MRIVGNPPSGGKKPGTPTIGTATAGDASATVAYTAPTYTGKGGAVTYTATSTPGSFTGTGASPITVSGLTNGTAYTFTVRAGTSYGVNSDESVASNSVTPAAAGSFESIATVTAAGGEITLSFTSIPQTYKALQIRCLIRNARALNSVGGLSIYFNTDNAGSNYASHRVYGNGASALAGGNTTNSTLTGIGWLTMPFNSITANIFGTSIVDIHDYASTTRNKTIRAFSGCDTNASTGIIQLSSGLWANTSALTSVTFDTGGGGNSFAAGSTFALYGIKG